MRASPDTPDTSDLGTNLPGYFVRAMGVEGKAPLLIVHSGFDGTGEEEYFEVGKPARERGYHCLIFGLLTRICA